MVDLLLWRSSNFLFSWLEYARNIYVWIFHDDLLWAKVFELFIFNDIELTWLVKAVKHILELGLIILPVIFAFWNFILSVAKTLIKFLNILLMPKIISNFRNLRQVFDHVFIESICLFYKCFLKSKQIPVFSDLAHQDVEKAFKLLVQVVSDLHDFTS